MYKFVSFLNGAIRVNNSGRKSVTLPAHMELSHGSVGCLLKGSIFCSYWICHHLFLVAVKIHIFHSGQSIAIRFFIDSFSSSICTNYLPLDNNMFKNIHILLAPYNTLLFLPYNTRQIVHIKMNLWNTEYNLKKN